MLALLYTINTIPQWKRTRFVAGQQLKVTIGDHGLPRPVCKIGAL